jgi:hypothetical protein
VLGVGEDVWALVEMDISWRWEGVVPDFQAEFEGKMGERANLKIGGPDVWLLSLCFSLGDCCTNEQSMRRGLSLKGC